MSIVASFSWLELFYASMTAVVTVLLVIGLRVFGKLPVSSFGPDFNLLTYGFLWDTTINAVKGNQYWDRFDPTVWPINKPTTLLVIAIFNLVLLAGNMKLANKVEEIYKQKGRTAYTEWFLKPVAIALGITSLIAFLFIQSVWS